MGEPAHDRRAGTTDRHDPAARPGPVPAPPGPRGVRLAEAARDFGVTERQLRSDLELLWVCGLPGYGPGDLIDLAFEGDRVRVTFTAGMVRPLRLTTDEAVALVVALRTLLELPGLAEREAVSRGAGQGLGRRRPRRRAPSRRSRSASTPARRRSPSSGTASSASAPSTCTTTCPAATSAPSARSTRCGCCWSTATGTWRRGAAGSRASGCSASTASTTSPSSTSPPPRRRRRTSATSTTASTSPSPGHRRSGCGWRAPPAGSPTTTRSSRRHRSTTRRAAWPSPCAPPTWPGPAGWWPPSAAPRVVDEPAELADAGRRRRPRRARPVRRRGRRPTRAPALGSRRGRALDRLDRRRRARPRRPRGPRLRRCSARLAACGREVEGASATCAPVLERCRRPRRTRRGRRTARGRRLNLLHASVDRPGHRVRRSIAAATHRWRTRHARLGPLEIGLIILAILLLFGYKKLPDASRSLGRSLRIFKGEMKGMKDDDVARARTRAPDDPRSAGAAIVPPATAHGRRRPDRAAARGGPDRRGPCRRAPGPRRAGPRGRRPAADPPLPEGDGDRWPAGARDRRRRRPARTPQATMTLIAHLTRAAQPGRASRLLALLIGTAVAFWWYEHGLGSSSGRRTAACPPTCATAADDGGCGLLITDVFGGVLHPAQGRLPRRRRAVGARSGSTSSGRSSPRG